MGDSRGPEDWQPHPSVSSGGEVSTLVGRFAVPLLQRRGKQNHARSRLQRARRISVGRKFSVGRRAIQSRSRRLSHPLARTWSLRRLRTRIGHAEMTEHAAIRTSTSAALSQIGYPSPDNLRTAFAPFRGLPTDVRSPACENEQPSFSPILPWHVPLGHSLPSLTVPPSGRRNGSLLRTLPREMKSCSISERSSNSP